MKILLTIKYMWIDCDIWFFCYCWIFKPFSYASEKDILFNYWLNFFNICFMQRYWFQGGGGGLDLLIVLVVKSIKNNIM